VPIDRGAGYEGAEEENEARLYGFKVTVTEVPDSKLFPPGSDAPPHLDTLDVKLDVSAGVAKMRAKKTRHGQPMWGNGISQESFDELVSLTRECILLNARRSRPPIR